MLKVYFFNPPLSLSREIMDKLLNQKPIIASICKKNVGKLSLQNDNFAIIE
ncbi:MAG: hypothetical protein RL660_2780 [Bacteroidota bacterium]|jgi:hypothetical protein